MEIFNFCNRNAEFLWPCYCSSHSYNFTRFRTQDNQVLHLSSFFPSNSSGKWDHLRGFVLGKRLLKGTDRFAFAFLLITWVWRNRSSVFSCDKNHTEPWSISWPLQPSLFLTFTQCEYTRKTTPCSLSRPSQEFPLFNVTAESASLVSRSLCLFPGRCYKGFFSFVCFCFVFQSKMRVCWA